MATINIELNSKPIKGGKEHNLLLRITVNGIRARIRLLYSVLPSQFNQAAQNSKYIKSSHPKYKFLNSKLEEKVQQAKEIISDLEKKKKPFTAKLIKQLMIEPESSDFFEYSEKVMKRLIDKNEVSNQIKYNTAIGQLKEFHGSDNLPFAEIDKDYVRKFEKYLIKKDLKQTTIHGYFAKIRAIFSRAVDEGIVNISDSPFYKYRIKEGKGNKDRLTLEEIIKLEELTLTPNSLISHVRTAFLFSFYNAGIRISDLLMLTWDNVKNGKLAYTMFKTNRVHSMTLKEKPLAILDQYRTDDAKPTDYIFPFFKNNIDYSDSLFLHNQIGSKTALINKYLKEIAKKVEITKNVTTHTARHSFADIARKKTDNIYNLSKTLGHSSIKVTEAYLASFDEQAVDDTLNNVFD